MQLKSAIEKRRSVKAFSHKRPDWRKILRALDSARLAPAAGNLISMKFILVSDEKRIKKIAEACQQDFVGTAQYLVVFVSDESKLIRMYGERAGRYASQQAGASIQNFLLSLTELGLVTTWVGHFVDEQVKRVLKIPDNLVVEAIFPIGKPTKLKTREKYKPELDKLVYFNEWGENKMNPVVKVRTSSV